MESSGQGNDEEVDVREDVLEAQLREEAQKKAEKEDKEKADKRKKLLIEGLKIFFIAVGVILSSYSVFVMPALQPHPATEVEEPTYTIIESARNWELMEMKIENKGSDETAEVTLEIRLPDNLTFNFDDTTNTKCSRPPNYNHTEDRLLVYRWYYLLPHTSIDISFHLNYMGVEELTSIIKPEHIVVSSKGEHGPIYEYPEPT